MHSTNTLAPRYSWVYVLVDGVWPVNQLLVSKWFAIVCVKVEIYPRM